MRSPGCCRSRVLALVIVMTMAVAGCWGSDDPSSSLKGPAYTLRVLGASNLGDLRPVLDAAQEATNVEVKLSAVPTLTATEQVLEGETADVYDATWFASDSYLRLHPGAAAKFDGSTEIMSSPVVLGLRPEAANRLGWTTGSVSWTDIADATAREELTFGMADPGKSQAGLAALVSVATALAGDGAALQPGQLGRALPKLSALFRAQRLFADSADALAERYRQEGTPKPDGLLTYESDLLSLNDELPEAERLTLVYPSDGVLTATYPLSLLATAPPEAKNAYQRLTRYLLTPKAQREISRLTHRRPIVTGIEPSAGNPFQLPFPGALSTVDDLLDTYRDALRLPGRTVYVLDVSGSMKGERLAGLKAALSALTGNDTSLTGRFSRFRPREQITLLPFAGKPGSPAVFDVPKSSPERALRQIRGYIDGLAAEGDTAIYTALTAAYRLMERQRAKDPDRINSVILLTDGENQGGDTLAAFTSFYRGLPAGAPPLFTIAFGDADKSELNRLATLTSGLTFDATAQPLTSVLQQIRGYQ